MDCRQRLILFSALRHAHIQIRPAQPSDINQLTSLYEALWPKASAEEHAKELRLILAGNIAAVLTMPLIIFAAEEATGD